MSMSYRACVLLSLSAALVVGCSRTPDPTANIDTALKQANLSDVHVDWDRDAHIAHLKGTVAQPSDRQRAEEVASAAVGTSGRVLNELTIRGLNDKTAGDLDRAIARTLKNTIGADAVLKDRDVDFDVNNGVVTVKGEVRTAAEKNRVSELVRAAPGVKDFANALEIKPKT